MSEEITAEATAELIAANDCIVEILESYMELCDYVLSIKNKAQLESITANRKHLWMPILAFCKEQQKRSV